MHQRPLKVEFAALFRPLSSIKSEGICGEKVGRKKQWKGKVGKREEKEKEKGKKRKG